MGWIEGTNEIAPIGAIIGFGENKFNFAFMLGVGQMSKLRAFGDFRQNMINMRTSVLDPITLPA